MSDDSSGAVVTAKVGAGALRPGLVVTEIQGIPHAMVADDVTLHNLEALLPQPSRITGERAFEEPDSFSAYVEQFKDEKTRVFGWPDKFLFNAIFDDHQRGLPQWGSHKAALQLHISPEWKAWMDACKKPLDQQDLAEFFEEHIEQIAEPDAGELLSGIRSVHISNNSRCDSVQREGGDIAFTLSTETSAGTKTATGKIPSRLTLFMAPFRSWHPVQVVVMLSYRLDKENGLSFTMRALNGEQLLNQAFNDVRNCMQESLALPVLV